MQLFAVRAQIGDVALGALHLRDGAVPLEFHQRVPHRIEIPCRRQAQRPARCASASPHAQASGNPSMAWQSRTASA